jgi:hypothetical protein
MGDPFAEWGRIAGQAGQVFQELRRAAGTGHEARGVGVEEAMQVTQRVA